MKIINQQLLRLILLALTALSCSLGVSAQTSEHVVILWDVTGSLLPAKATRDLNGTKLPTYQDGNGMWVALKKAIIDCIQFTESDPDNKITVVTFNDNIRDVFTRNATDVGKNDLVNIVENYTYVSHNWTNIVDPIKKFYSILDSSKINYMFLFTDGENDHPGTKPHFISTLGSWASKTSSYDAFGFYVIVHPAADKNNIRSAVESQDKFWIVPDAKVRIKICTLPSSIKYNLRDDKGPKTICMSGRYFNADGNVDLTFSDPYYDVLCTNQDIKDGKFDIEVKPKAGLSPPANHTIILSPVISNADQYTFVGPNKVELEVSNLPERSLDLTLKSNKLGKASYYDSFLWVSEESTSIVSNVKVNFSEQASREGSSATMMAYFMDKKGKDKISPSKSGFKLLMNGEETESIKLTPEISEVVIEMIGDGETKDGVYYGRIQLIPSNLDNYTINCRQDIFKWKFDFDEKCNPLKLALIILLILLVLAFILWILVLRPVFFPRFGSILKTFNVPGMAPLIIKFKGARQVIVSANPQKRQSVRNKFWTGKIVYKIHPAFITPIVFVPGRGKKVLVRTESGAYQISPNPMPGIGSAVITDIRQNKKINVN